jgi:hypothetical protein
MVDLRDLDPETRCFALVGQFLQAWSVLEQSLRAAIIRWVAINHLCSGICERSITVPERTASDLASSRC